MALPTPNGTTDVNGKFTITAAPIQNIIIKSVSSAQTPTRVLNFISADDFRGPESYPASQNDYFNVPATSGKYYIHFGLEVTAGSSAFTIGPNAVRLSQSFVAGGASYSPKSVTLYDSTFTQRNQITIPAGETQVVYLVASVALLSLNANGQEETNTTNQYFSTDLSIFQNGIQIGRDQIRVRNYNF